MPCKILCVVPSKPEDLKAETVRSVLDQTFPVEMLVLLPKKSKKQTTSDRVVEVLNDGLSRIRLEDFDYLLRLDGDTTLPSNFLEENLRECADLCGKSGCAMLIKVSTFMRLMNGRFSVLSDDTYLGLKFLSGGATVKDWKIPARHRSVVHSGLTDYMFRGYLFYKVGYEPIHVVFQSLIHAKSFTLRDFATVITYFFNVFRHTEKYDVADFVRQHQISRLAKLKFKK